MEAVSLNIPVNSEGLQWMLLGGDLKVCHLDQPLWYSCPEFSGVRPELPECHSTQPEELTQGVEQLDGLLNSVCARQNIIHIEGVQYAVGCLRKLMLVLLGVVADDSSCHKW